MSNDRTSPRVTIVMTARERHTLTEAAIETLVAETTIPYRFIYVDAQSPSWLRQTLDERAGEWNLEVVRYDEPVWPQEARRRIAPTIETEYAVFVDNDIQVESGWLEALIACADETGAGIVGPLYLWGDGLSHPKIHMAGGRLLEVLLDDGTRVLDEEHHLLNADPRAVRSELVRTPCDFVEYHCMLIRGDLVRSGALFDSAIRCVHEHIDTSLTAAAHGYAIMFEPAAQVQYMAFSDHMLEDLPFFRDRWALAEGDASIRAFSSKWRVVDDERSFGGVRDYLRAHNERADPLRQMGRTTDHVQRPMTARDLPQTRSALLDLAARQGYAPPELDSLAAAYGLAQRLFDGGYRPCGRPFINHATGTAAVLVHYGFALRVVLAGLLHAAYTHGPRDEFAAIVHALGGERSELERRVRAFTEREQDSAANDALSGYDTLSIFEAEILALEAANEIDMHLSGEFRYTGRDDEISPRRFEEIAQVCRIIGVPGLSATLETARSGRLPVATVLQTGHQGSYRFQPGQQAVVGMVDG
ncbi:MAG: glycosyltransferase [Casimicrobiaceae bacterium]